MAIQVAKRFGAKSVIAPTRPARSTSSIVLVP
jgi:hypothetical protein